MTRITFIFTIFLFISQILFLPGNSNAAEQTISSVNYMQRGLANLSEENYEEAIEDFQKERELNPTSSLAAYFLGTAYKKTYDFERASKQFKEAIDLRPAVKEALIELVDTLYQLGRIEEAKKKLEIAESNNIEPAKTAFLKGLLLLAEGENLDAIDSFEKAKLLDTRLAKSADYQIGVANIQHGRLKEGKAIFQEIIISDPNSDFAQVLNQYVSAVDKRLYLERPFRLSASLHYQYDDNVLLKPGDSSAAAGITNEGDDVGLLTLRGEYVPKLKGPYGLKTQYSFFGSSHSHLKSHDVASHTLAVVPSYNSSKSSASLLASYNYSSVDDNKYLETWTISPTYSFSLSSSQFMQMFARYQDKQFHTTALYADEERSGENYSAGANWFLMLKKTGFLSVNYEFSLEDTDGVNWEYMGNKVGVSLAYPFLEKLRINIGGEANYQDFDNVSTFFNKKRKDHTYAINTGFTLQFTRNMALQLQYSYTRVDSNIAVYDYDKNVFTAGLELTL